MALNLKSFRQLVDDQAAAMQSRAGRLLDFTVGSVLRAWIEANASIGMWFQSVIAYLVTLTRAATSSGADLDTWVGDFGLVRLTARGSAGAVVISRYTATAVAYVPVGLTVRTTDGSQSFTVVADASRTDFDNTNQRYVVPVGVSSVAVPVAALTPGVASNVAAGTITLIIDAAPGLDTVNNSIAMTGGADQETDGALRKRFVSFIASLSRATPGALAYAIDSLRLGADHVIIENERLDGTADYGFVTVMVDDGTGAASGAFVQNCQGALNLYRAAGIRVAAFAAQGVPVLLTLDVQVADGYRVADVEGRVGAAILAYVNALTTGSNILYAAIVAKAYDVPGVSNVTLATIGGAKADFVITNRQKARVQNVAVSGA